MRRLWFAFAFALGALFLGATSASASTYCSLDPTLGVGTPLTSSTTLTTSTSLLSTDTYASTTSSSTTFGGGATIK